jgi:cyclopropane-fatty-acyl-phospholipid synthase
VRVAARAGELGYDLRFRRLWELYLAYSEGGFLERRIGDVQALFAGPAYRGRAAGGDRAASALAGS